VLHCWFKACYERIAQIMRAASEIPHLRSSDKSLQRARDDDGGSAFCERARARSRENPYMAGLQAWLKNTTLRGYLALEANNGG